LIFEGALIFEVYQFTEAMVLLREPNTVENLTTALKIVSSPRKPIFNPAILECIRIDFFCLKLYGNKISKYCYNSCDRYEKLQDASLKTKK